jgi:hypothetical protein
MGPRAGGPPSSSPTVVVPTVVVPHSHSPIEVARTSLDILRLTEELLARDAVKAVASRFTNHLLSKF